MSGCFDDAVGDAEGTDDADGGTTVINNYYYNNTTVMPTPTTEVLYIPANTTAELSVSPGQMIEVVEVWSAYDGDDLTDYARTVSVDFNCSTHTEMQTAHGIGVFSTYSDFASDWLPSDGTSCTYYFDRSGHIYSITSNPYFGDAYIIYRIHNIG